MQSWKLSLLISCYRSVCVLLAVLMVLVSGVMLCEFLILSYRFLSVNCLFTLIFPSSVSQHVIASVWSVSGKHWPWSEIYDTTAHQWLLPPPTDPVRIMTQQEQQFTMSLEAALAWMQVVQERLKANDNTQGPRDALEARLRETEVRCLLFFWLFTFDPCYCFRPSHHTLNWRQLLLEPETVWAGFCWQ